MNARERIAAKARTLPRELFLELNHDPSRSALVLGSGRSGTTWLAEAIARRHGSRLLFEPFHPILGSIHGELRLFQRPADGDPAFERAVRRVLSGRVRTVHIDQVLTARLPRSRIVKDVHATNLLPWLRANHPAVPVILVVRNPIATASSRLSSSVFYGLGDYLATPAGRADAEDSPAAAWLPLYDTHRAHPDRLVRLVAEWCIENVYPLSCIDDAGVALAFYENVVLNPIAELARLGESCRTALGSAARAPHTLSEARKPSAMDWLGTAAAVRRSGDWEQHLSRWTDEVPAPTVDRCMRVLSDFGLDRLYGEGPLPTGDAGAPS
ncbi:MAG: sulfotransferase [Mycobacteriales bacterium]